MRSKGCCAEVDSKATAPNGYRPVFRQVNVQRQVIVLIPYVALERSYVDKPDIGHCLAVVGIFGGYQIDLNIRAVGSLKFAEP
jgi:hypothetical protein